MRILQVYHIYPALFGGVSTVVYQITKELFKRGHEINVLTANDFPKGTNGCEDENGIKVYRFRSFSKRLYRHNIVIPNMEFVSWVKRMMRKYHCIHLHGYRNPYNIVVHHYARKYDVPYISQAHGSLPSFMVKQRSKRIYDAFFGYRLLRNASKVIAYSQTEAQQYRNMDVSEKKIAVIPNGIDFSEYADLPPKGSFKKKFCIADSEKIVLYLGRIHRVKGIDFLIRSFARLIKNGIENSKLVIAGPDDGYLTETRSLVDSLALGDKVLFTGVLLGENKIGAYVDSTICAYLNPYEPFGIVSLEAAASRTPVVVVDGTPMSEIVKRGGFGVTVRYGDVEALAKLLESFLVDDVPAIKMGTRGRRYVAENYSIEKIVDKLEKLYESVKANKCGRSQNY